MNKKNRITQIMAILALFGIIIGIIGTGLLFIFSGSENSNYNLNEKQLMELQNYINTLSGSIETMSGTETITGSKIE